jgi:hypothetical protein
MRKLRKALGQSRAQLSLVRSTLTEDARRKLGRVQELAGREQDALARALEDSQARVAELETVKGALRVLWRRLTGRGL